MATVIDNSGGDPTQFGQVLNNIGNTWVQNNFRHKQLEQEQQQINNAYEIAKGQLKNQDIDTAMRQRAANAGYDANAFGNQTLGAWLNGMDASQAPQSSAQNTALPPVNPSAVVPNNIVAPTVTPAQQTPTTPSKTGTPTNAPVGESSIQTPSPKQGVLSPEASTIPTTIPGVSLPNISNISQLASDAGNAMLDTATLGNSAILRHLLTPGSQMSPEEEVRAAQNKVKLLKQLKGGQPAPSPAAQLEPPTPDQFVSSAVKSPEAPVQPSVQNPVQPAVNTPTTSAQSAANAPQTPAAQVTQAISTITTPGVTPGELLGRNADPATAKVVSSFLPPEIISMFKKAAADPKMHDVPLSAALQNMMQLQLAPLGQQVAQSDLQTKLLQNRMSQNIMGTQANMLSGNVSLKNQDGSPNYANIETYAKMMEPTLGAEGARLRAYQAAGLQAVPEHVAKAIDSEQDRFNKDSTVANAQDAIDALTSLKQGLAEPGRYGDDLVLQSLQKIHNKSGVSVTEGNLESLLKGVPLGAKFNFDFFMDKIKKGDILPPQTRDMIARLAEHSVDAKVDYVKNHQLKTARENLQRQGAPANAVGYNFDSYKSGVTGTSKRSASAPASSGGGKIVVQNGNKFQINPDGSHSYLGPASQ